MIFLESLGTNVTQSRQIMSYFTPGSPNCGINCTGLEIQFLSTKFKRKRTGPAIPNAKGNQITLYFPLYETKKRDYEMKINKIKWTLLVCVQIGRSAYYITG